MVLGANGQVGLHVVEQIVIKQEADLAITRLLNMVDLIVLENQMNIEVVVHVVIVQNQVRLFLHLLKIYGDLVHALTYRLLIASDIFTQKKTYLRYVI